MSDETKASQDNFDEELARAAEEVRSAGEEVEEIEEEIKEVIEEVEEQEEAEEPVEVKDNKESSRLGRKVKKLEETISELTDLISRMEVAKQTEEEVNPDDIITVGEMDKYIENRENKKKAERLQYQQQYALTFTNMNNESFSEEIEEEMYKKFNEVVTGDPKRDAQINFLRAKTSILEKKVGEKKVPVKGETPPGINTGSKVAAPKKKQKQLDPAAEAFLKKEGLDRDWVDGAF